MFVVPVVPRLSSQSKSSEVLWCHPQVEVSKLHAKEAGIVVSFYITNVSLYSFLQ